MRSVAYLSRLAVAALLALASPLAVLGCQRAGPPGGAAGSAQVAAAHRNLRSLPVARPASMRGYSRDRFPHWRRVGRGCDVRDSVLRRDGLTVRSDGCNVRGGRWLSPYDGRTLTRVGDVDVDHVVPLANAWRSGAAAWTEGRRAAFANDLERPQLIAVSATANRDKADRDPAQWLPPNRAQWCRYATNWIAVKAYWKLSITRAEKRALHRVLESC